MAYSSGNNGGDHDKSDNSSGNFGKSDNSKGNYVTDPNVKDNSRGHMNKNSPRSDHDTSGGDHVIADNDKCRGNQVTDPKDKDISTDPNGKCKIDNDIKGIDNAVRLFWPQP